MPFEKGRIEDGVGLILKKCKLRFFFFLKLIEYGRVRLIGKIS